jgi:hypothetical protein
VICKHFSFGGFGVNKAQDVHMMTIKVPRDLHRELAELAAQNISSLNAEIVRSARERVEREKAKAR